MSPGVVKEELTTDPMMSTSDEMIGSTAVWASGYTGAGRKIAIIDTGIDVDHPALDPDALAYALEGSNASLMTSADTAKVLSQLNAAKQYKGLTAEDLYVNAKIPFGFNYVDNGLNIGHDKDTQGDHGSHVAGIAAANRYVKAEDGSFANALDTVLTQGVAPDAQLLVMKVFGVTGGAYPDDYMAAVEDAMVLGADSANLSLGGSWTGNSRAEETYAKILERVTKSGMVVVISAGNSGSWYEETAVGSAYADGVSFATSGAPGTYTNSLGVASVDNVGQTGLYIDVAGNKMFYTESLESQSGSKYTNLSITTLAGEQEYVYLDSIGTAEEFAAIKDVLAGKIAICNRGELNFTDKLENAVSNGAIATIVANNQPGTLGMELSAYTRTEPAVTISQADAATLKAASTPVTDDSGKVLYYTGKLTISDAVGSGVSAADHYTMSSFSSWGVPGSLELKPEITAPGGNIYSLKNGGCLPEYVRHFHGRSPGHRHGGAAGPVSGRTGLSSQDRSEHPCAGPESADVHRRAHFRNGHHLLSRTAAGRRSCQHPERHLRRQLPADGCRCHRLLCRRQDQGGAGRRPGPRGLIASASPSITWRIRPPPSGSALISSPRRWLPTATLPSMRTPSLLPCPPP